MARFHRTICAGVKRRRHHAAVLGGLLCALVISPALANSDGSPACRWQPIVRGLRNLRPPADLKSEELKCGIADPVDVAPDSVETIDRLNQGLHAAAGWH